MLPPWLGAADAIRSAPTARIHHATQRRGGDVAAGRAGATADRPNRQDAPTGHFDAGDRRAFRSYLRSILPRAARTWLHRGPEPGHRAPKRGLEIGSAPHTGSRTGWTERRHPCRVEHDNG